MLSIGSIGSYIIAIALLIIVLKILTLPLKIIFKFVFNSILGGIVLFILAGLGIMVKIEWWTVVLTGLFGIPGLVCATLITIIL